MLNLDYYDGGRLVRVPVVLPPEVPMTGDAEPEPDEDTSCGICNLPVCDCDGIYDRWKDR